MDWLRFESIIGQRRRVVSFNYSYQNKFPIYSQSKSWMIQVSAAVRFIPIPPALVERRNTGIEGSLLNWSIKICLCDISVCPSRRKNFRRRVSSRQPSKSRHRVHWEKIRTRWLLSISSGKRCFKRENCFQNENIVSWKKNPKTSYLVAIHLDSKSHH